MRTITIIAILFTFAAGGWCGQKKYEAGTETVTRSAADDEFRKMGRHPGVFSSGVVEISVPKDYYELAAPGLDKLYFNRFYPYPMHDESALSGPDGKYVRIWLAQLELGEEQEMQSRRQQGMGFAVSDGGMIATSADLFKNDVDITAVKKFFMEYLRSGESGYDADKVSKIKEEDIIIQRRGDNRKVGIKFFSRQMPNKAIPPQPPRPPRNAGADLQLPVNYDTVNYRVYRYDQPYKAGELINYDDHIAIVRIADGILPPKTHVFKTYGAERLSAGGRIIRLETMSEARYSYLVMRGAQNPVTVGSIDSITGIFDYNYFMNGRYEGRPGAPLIGPRGNILGMHLKQLYEKGADGERKSYGITAEKINEKIVSLGAK